MKQSTHSITNFEFAHFLTANNKNWLTTMNATSRNLISKQINSENKIDWIHLQKILDMDFSRSVQNEKIVKHCLC